MRDAIATHPSVSSATAVDNPLSYAASMGSCNTTQFFEMRMVSAQSKCLGLLDKGSAVDGSDPRAVPLFAAKVDVMELMLKIAEGGYADAANDGRQATVKLLLEKGIERFISEGVLHDNPYLKDVVGGGVSLGGD
ncbi:hypothetical protein EV426DRAFT_701022 [Tirmania nivea]|nr:hypothetical protein EV426DRAFT_701022 [Tirmania nivea]